MHCAGTLSTAIDLATRCVFSVGVLHWKRSNPRPILGNTSLVSVQQSKVHIVFNISFRVVLQWLSGRQEFHLHVLFILYRIVVVQIDYLTVSNNCLHIDLSFKLFSLLIMLQALLSKIFQFDIYGGKARLYGGRGLYGDMHILLIPCFKVETCIFYNQSGHPSCL